MRKIFLALFVLCLNLAAQDTDGDGASDSFEIATGFDPALSSSTPPDFQSIGVNFANSEAVIWPLEIANGYLPQSDWNHIHPNNSPSTYRDASGNNTTLTVDLESINGGGFLSYLSSQQVNNVGEQLTNSYLRSPKISLSNIPYTNYDLYVYGSTRLGFDVVDVTLSPGAAEEETLTAFTTRSPLKPFLLVGRGRPDTPFGGNVFRFPGLTGSSLVFQGSTRVDAGGISGFQIVNTTPDADNDQLPDWWELKHRTGAKTSNAAANLDQDGLDHRAEFLQGTDPNHADSDRDGLNDSAEIAAGTDPLYADSDDDGLSDYAELFSANPTDPLKADTDDDGIPDLEELRLLTNPGNTAPVVPLPTTVTSTEFLWEVPNLQLRWNHNLIAGLDREQSSTHIFAATGIQNTSAESFVLNTYLPSLFLGLQWSGEKIVSVFKTRRQGSFWEITNQQIERIGTTDLKESLGFSGFGTHDFSAPLTLRVEASRPNTSASWTLTYRIINQQSGSNIVSETLTGLSAHASINQGGTTWRTADRLDGFATPPILHNTILDPAVTLFANTPLFDSIPALADKRDLNNDGLPDQWATENSVSNPEGDRDSDGLTNREEFHYGTDPNKVDSDGDGLNDFLEWQTFSTSGDSTARLAQRSRNFPITSDLNGNGMSDLWESQNLKNGPLDPAADPDGDGFSNLSESISGTDPFDASSAPILRITAQGQNSHELTWTPADYKISQVQTSPSLDGSWQNAIGTAGNSQGLSTLEVPIGNQHAFYRLNIRDQDRDSDGVSDADEAILQTDPLQPNSSGQPLPQDFDGDGEIDRVVSGDYRRLLESYQTSETTPGQREASRFLLQTTFGPRLSDIEQVLNEGIPAWLDEQFALPPSYHQMEIEKLLLDSAGARVAGGYRTSNQGQLGDPRIAVAQISSAFANIAIKEKDQLRQRMAFALSQLFVVSFRDANLQSSNSAMALANYYDLLVKHAFGNYYDLLKAVARHPVMGVYLSHLGNQKADLSINRFPDENFAREVMQLFSIGLHELEQNGNFKLDSSGERIETYDENDIAEMARVMTGLDRAGRNPFSEGQGTDLAPMIMVPERHDFGEKVILKTHTIPAREETLENAEADLDEALLVLFEHPNTAPFISRSFIRFFVSDNPSPAYVERIANVFDDDGTGTRGNLGAMLKAILLDPEARDFTLTDKNPAFGRLRGPAFRTMHLARLLGMDRHVNLQWWEGSDDTISLQGGQVPLHAPTVFNFYEPDHSPQGLLFENGLVGGPFQMINSATSISFPNLIWEMTTKGFIRTRNPQVSVGYHFPPFYDELLPYTDDEEAYVDLLNLLICGGRMSIESRTIILQSLRTPFYQNPANREARVALGLYGAFIIPESAIVR